MKKLSILIFAIGSIYQSFAQSTKGGAAGSNTRDNNNQFLGWDNQGTSGSLEIRNAFSGQPILFQTGLSGGNPINRMKLNGDVNYDINGVGSAARNGYLLLGGNTNLSFLTSGRLRERV